LEYLPDHKCILFVAKEYSPQYRLVEEFLLDESFIVSKEKRSRIRAAILEYEKIQSYLKLMFESARVERLRKKKKN
jgi:hypothetical protein